jgi:hypothetical protein
MKMQRAGSEWYDEGLEDVLFDPHAAEKIYRVAFYRR